MWPMRYENMTRDECRKCLRCLELEAYGNMVSVLRAQGPFTSEKQKLLQELAKVLHISNERHRAEVRRAVNDEKLATIAEQLSGPNTGTDWTIEGRRAIPLLPRLKARSAFTTLANSLSLATVAANKRNLPVHEKTEDAKDIRNESPLKIKVQENSFNNHEIASNKDKLSDENVLTEVTESDRNKEINNQSNTSDGSEKYIVSEKRKPSSPLSPTLPNKVLVVSSSSIGAINHGTTDKGSFENTIHLSRMPTNSLQHQNVTIIPLNINCGESDSESKELAVQDSESNHSVISSSNFMNTVIPIGTTNITKAKGRIITTQNKLNTKIGPAILVSGNVSCTSGNNFQSDIQDTSIQDNLSPKTSSISHNLQKASCSENSNSISSNTKRIVPVIHSNVKSPITKTITSSNSHRLMTVCPVTTVSNGPGPPQAKQITTLTCKKLPTTLNNQTTAKMGVTLNSNKTVNISHHPDTKLGSKTNVIVIQKGQTKGVTLSQAGKEVLGKVIMGGKSLCVTSQHNTSINVVPRHVTLNNGDQGLTVLSTTNSSHTESITSNIKSGNTIMFNLRQDVLEKNKALSHLLESSNVLTSESKTVIQNTNALLSKEPSNSDLHVQDKELIVKTDAVITTVKDETHSQIEHATKFCTYDIHIYVK
ncbi:BRCA2-interacting transcriptional repressor EMSY isoform X1 [Apis mellifera caucasica]|uniref:BRCA2-interacting transcriptional repressor EMSY isoform X1 n=1 Tax=Apis mellifera TaxID=7460 RepID=A0A7M7GYP6_APIME|nr:BRCA2-interacting transcriptional repressor EMSY isoform X1 [Apis mellifera]KAG6796717.1 BRCA2-interacting transcriptional repressor EMSY isoform X1 [Apis mellifera caucasica]KAG9436483.1 BRCA2-interacting transcriptional repressor EMSY isoform X1 [Apis mellifera carnica]|eukprot:XP_006570964.1 BRCA2-interacting transcriptional repressor EMSY isoform X1 [Apis mellifera]